MRNDGDEAVLLDTHVWYWYVQEEKKRFARRIEPLIESAVQRGAVVISAVSIWELALLEAARRIDLSIDIRHWIARALRFPGVRLKGLSASIVIDSTRLPGNLHRDPADRILVATARQLGAALVTCDQRILNYAKKGYVKAVDANP